MPVKFLGTSEYSSVFKWSPSFRSKRFSPTRQQSAPDAGMRSDEFYLLNEPGFTHKKSVKHRLPEAGSCLIWEASLQDNDDQQSTVGTICSIDVSKQVKPVEEPVIVETKVPNCEIKKENNKKNQKNQKSVKKSPKKLQKDLKVNSKDENQAKAKSSNQPKTAIIEESKPVIKKTSIPLKYRSRKMLPYSYPTCRSEYQLMYKKPKNIFRSSPLISAYDVVYSSSALSSRKPPFKFKSEYSVSYKKDEDLKKPELKSPASPSMKVKVRHLHKPSKKNSSKKEKSIPTLNKHRNIKSEYEKEFSEYNLSSQQQVIEEVEKNKLNRDGLNFDRQHAGQLHSQVNTCWDLSSQSTSSNHQNKENEAVNDCYESSSVRTDSLENIKIKPVVRKLDWSEAESANDEEEDKKIEDENMNDKSIKKESVLANCDENKHVPMSEVDSLTNRSSTTIEGRITTPELKTMGGALRTHHDITTPSKGGALLSSPKMKLNKTEIRKKSLVTNEKKPAKSDKPFTELPKKLQVIVRAPIRGALRSEEFQHFSNNTRPLNDLDRISLASRQSSASAQDLLERSLKRRGFWSRD